MMKYDSLRPAKKYEIITQTPKLLKKALFSPSIRISGKNTIFDNKKAKKVVFIKTKDH